MDEDDRLMRRVRIVLTVADTVMLLAQRLAILWAISIVANIVSGLVAPYDYIGTFAGVCLSIAAGVTLARRWHRQGVEEKARDGA